MTEFTVMRRELQVLKNDKRALGKVNHFNARQFEDLSHRMRYTFHSMLKAIPNTYQDMERELSNG